MPHYSADSLPYAYTHTHTHAHIHRFVQEAITGKITRESLFKYASYGDRSLLVRFCQQDDPDPNSGNPKKVKKKARIGSRFRLLAGLFAIYLCLPLNVPCTMNPVRYILSADR